jgi:steroid delta-isomerase-like uncharacterized protein
MSDLERNKKVLHRFWKEVWNDNKLDVVDEIFHQDFVDHGLAPGLTKQGPEGAKEAVMQFRTAMPDLWLRVDGMIAEDDKVMTRWTAGGTHDGPMGPFAATGKKGEIQGVTINRLVDGRILEAWDNFDMLGMMAQLGVVPEMSGPGRPPGGPPGQDGPPSS